MPQLADAEHNEAEIRHHCDETAIFGTTDQICRKLEALRAGGVEYVIVNFGGSKLLATFACPDCTDVVQVFVQGESALNGWPRGWTLDNARP